MPAGDAVTPYCTYSSKCDATTGGWNKGGVVSKADGYPIVYINAHSASEACKSMGDGYHLMTNAEWMTVARNIEQVSTNWSNGLVGSGYIYTGHTSGTPNYSLSGSLDDNDSMYGITGGTGNTSSNNGKRTLTLSNGQIIWDLSGNDWEILNKANTISGSGYNSSTITSGNVCGGNGWYSFYNNDGSPACSYTGSYQYESFGPITKGLNAANGIGRVYSVNTFLSTVITRG